MADRHWKATRSDGTDWHSGMFDYANALADDTLVRHPATLDPDDAATYLSVATAPTACVGMSWPCRLFVVEPVGHQPCERIPHKVICSALRVLEERPAHEALGPQGEEVAALIERAKRLTYEEVETLAALDATQRDTWIYTWSTLWQLACEHARDHAFDTILNTAWGVLWDAVWSVINGWVSDGEVLRKVTPCIDAVLNAAVALYMRDLIEDRHFELLYHAWREVIGDE